MGMFEVDAKTVDLNAFMNGMSAKQRARSHFIWIGVLAVDSPRKVEMQRYNDGLMIVTPPRLNGLRLKQQSFRQCMEQYKWNYVLEKEEDDDKDDEDKDNKDEDDEEVDDESNVDGKHNTSSPTTSNKKRKCNAIMPPGDAKTYPHPLQALGGEDGWCDAKTYPHLLQALGGEDGCVNPTNPAVLKSMRSLQSELKDLLSSTYQHDVSRLSHNKLSYL